MSVRIIAGERRGAVLKTPPGLRTRPTLGRVRASLFMILQPVVPGARVLDLFAGCGALGLEALSRGAAHALFVETAPAALAALRANIERLGWADRARVAAVDARTLLRRGEPPGGEPFDLVLMDPPYGSGLAQVALERLAAGAPRWLAPGAWAAVQVDRDDPLPEQHPPLIGFRVAAYGRTRVVFYRVQV